MLPTPCKGARGIRVSPVLPTEPAPSLAALTWAGGHYVEGVDGSDQTGPPERCPAISGQRPARFARVELCLPRSYDCDDSNQRNGCFAGGEVHTLVRRFIKTGIAFLLAGILLGGWMVIRRELYGTRAKRERL